jgi:hypothetical protein
VPAVSEHTASPSALGEQPKADTVEPGGWSHEITLDGAWSATISDGKGSAVVQFNLIQNSEGDVLGTYTSSLGGGGEIKGSFKNSQFMFELKQSLKNCPGIFKGTATMVQLSSSEDIGKLVGTYTGTDCLGDHGKGSLTMTKGVGQATPVKAPSAVQITDGKPAELRGVKYIAVLAAGNLPARNEIARLLRENGFEVVEPVRADLGLVFSIKYSSQGEIIVADVEGSALRATASPILHRVWTYSNRVMKSSVKEQDLAKAFVKEFLNVYRRENH